MGASGLGSLLVKEGFLTEQDRLTITKTCGQGSWAFAKSILAIGLLDEEELAAFFAERTRYQIAPRNFLSNLDESAIHALDRRLVSKLEVIPLKKDNGKITVGVVDPLDRSTLKQLEFFTGLEVDPIVIPLSQLYEGLARIDPDFRLAPTALTDFLQNHAQAAWVRQKLEINPGTVMPATRAVGGKTLHSNGNEIEEVDDDLPEVEELEDDLPEVEELEEDDFVAEIAEMDDGSNRDDIDPFGGTAGETDDDNDLSAEIAARSNSGDDILEMVDENDDDDNGAMGGAALGAAAGVMASKSFQSDLDLLGDSSESALDFGEKSRSLANENSDFDIEGGQKPEGEDPFDLGAELSEGLSDDKAAGGDGDFDLEAALNDEALGERPDVPMAALEAGEEAAEGELTDASEPAFDLDFALEASTDSLDEKPGDEEQPSAGEVDLDLNAASAEGAFRSELTESEQTDPADDELSGGKKAEGFEAGSSTLTMAPTSADHDPFDDEGHDFDQDDGEADAQPKSTFGFEETKPRAMPRPAKVDALDTLNDQEPGIDESGFGEDGIDDQLFADLHAESEADDHTPRVTRPDEPNFPGMLAVPLTATSSPAAGMAFTPPKAPAHPMKNQFDDDEETHIDLRHSHVAATDIDDEDDILLHPKKVPSRPSSDSGLNPTSALNETMLKISLCFQPNGILDILSDVLYKIGDAGCFINTKSQKQIVWGGGQLIKGDLSPSTLLPMLKGGLPNRWQAIELKANESWTKRSMKLKLYRTGHWLWAHSMKNSDDTMIFRDTVESMASQVMNKLGAG